MSFIMRKTEASSEKKKKNQRNRASYPLPHAFMEENKGNNIASQIGVSLEGKFVSKNAIE